MEAMLTIISKVAVMLILILVGYFVTKKGWMTDRGTSEINTLLLQIVTPCLIVNSFLTSEDTLSAWELLLSVGTSALAIALSIGLSYGFSAKSRKAGGRCCASRWTSATRALWACRWWRALWAARA